MSLHRRLERLEARHQGPEEPGGYTIPLHMERYFHAVENYRRELDGLELLPDLPHTEEDYHDALRTIAAYRGEPSWQTGQAKALLDQWEQDLNHKLYERSETKGT